ncbi:hypothetical protein [Arachidicoccus terrestris]|uniref:hypothetical protein n=1 Tax=Arachidicoccus terrestris TaxID=2875539 RepID=UPI001CC5F39F|nr:hypothetical protein [Arachidicoccus terrestris]UAY54792.1 hypothetical protein K9M52_15290 [Arachidicoccus terrestris]
MKIYQLLEQLIARFVPLDDATKAELHLESVNVYSKIANERLAIIEENERIKAANEKGADQIDYIPIMPKKMPLKMRIVGVLEQWYMRYFFAVLFIFLVPKIKSYINGEGSARSRDSDDFDDHDDDDYDDLDDDDDAEYEEFRRWKKRRSMR